MNKCITCQGVRWVKLAVETGRDSQGVPLFDEISKPCRSCNPDGRAPASGIEPPELAKNVITGEQQAEGRKRAASTRQGFSHPFLKSKLWEECPVCKGTKKTQHPAMVDGMPTTDGKSYTGPLPAGSECTLCENGFVEVGMTTGQLERLRAEQEVLITAVVCVRELLALFNGHNGKDVQDGIATAVSEVLAKINKSDVTRAEDELRKMRRFVNPPQKPQPPKPA